MADALADAPPTQGLMDAALPAMPAAPDVSTFTASTPETQAPVAQGETDPFQQAVYDNTKNLPSPDSIVQHGQQTGRSPQDIAQALQQLKASSSDAMQKVAEDNPEHTDQAFSQRQVIDEEINKRIEGQQQQATAAWAQDHFQNEGDFRTFASQYDHDPQAAAQQNPQAANELTKILRHPSFQQHHSGPGYRLKSPDGTDYGWAQAHPDMRGGYDVQVSLNNGKGSGSFKVKGGSTKKDAYDSFVKSPIGKKAGESHFLSGATASAGKSVDDIGAMLLDKLSMIPGLTRLHDESTTLRQYARSQYEKAAKTTKTGMLGDVERGAEELTGKLPVWTAGGPVGLPLEMWASAEAKGKNMADDLADQAFKERDHAKQQKLIEQSVRVRDLAPLYGLVSAVTGVVAGKLVSLPLKGVMKLLPKVQQEAVGKWIASRIGSMAAETANAASMELVQGQVVDPAFGYDRAPLSNLLNPGNLLFGAIFGAKRYHAGAKARAEAETAQKVTAGTINSPQQIFDAIHGKAEETETKSAAPGAAKFASPPSDNFIKTAKSSADVMIAEFERQRQEQDGKANSAALDDLGPKPPEKLASQSAAAIASRFPNVGDTVEYEGYTGTLGTDEDGRPVVHLPDGKTIVEVEPGSDAPRRAGPVLPGTKPGTWKHPMEQWADQKISSSKERTNIGLDPELLFAYGVKGGHLIARGLRTFGNWSKEMLRQFGEAIKPHLTRIWKKAVQYAYDILIPDEARAGASNPDTSFAGIPINVHAPGGKVAQPAVKFQDTTQPKEKGWLDRLNPKATRARQAEMEEFRQALNAHGGEINAGNMAFDALQKVRENEGTKLDTAKFEKDSLLGAAIHVYRQAKGDTDTLTDQRDQLKAKGGSQYAPVWEKAINLTDAEKALSDKVTQDYKENALTAQAAGLSLDVDEAYGKQVWDLENNRGKAGFGDFLSRFESDPSSFKKRKHASSFDGIMAGLTPKSLDDFKLVGVNGKEVNRAVATRKLAQRLPELRDAQGRPLAIIDSDQSSKLNDSAVERLKALAASGVAVPVQMRSYIPYHRYAVGGAKVENFDPTGYKPAGGRGIQGYFYQLPAAEGGMKNYFGRLLFHPEAFPYINARTAPSIVREIASRKTAGGYIVRGILALNREVKASLLGAFSAFHYVQEGFHGLGHGTNPLWNLPPVDPLNPEHLEWMKAGLMLGGEHDAIKYFDGGGDLSALFYKIPVLGHLSQKMSEHLFLRYIPALKLKTAQNVYNRNQKYFAKPAANGSMSDAEIRHITATTVNDAYGHINWADLGIGKSMRDFLQVTALAPDFLIARSRFAAQALGVQRIRGVDASRASREAFMAMFALAAGQWIVARVGNWILNDGDMRTADMKDLFAIVDKKSGQRFSLRSVPGDLAEAITKPVEFFNNRASPLVRDLYNVIMGTNWRGENVGHGAALTDSLVGAVPMTAQPLVRGLTTTGQQAPTSRTEDFFKAAGVKINRFSQLGEAKSKAHDYMSTHDAKTGTDYHQPSVYNPMLFHLLDGDEEGAKAELDKLTAGDARGTERVVKGFHASLFRAFTGDAAHEVNFRREMSKTDLNRQMLKEADQQRLDAWRLFQKVGRVSGDLRTKYQGRLTQPTDATQAKARELRLAEAGQ